MRRLTAALSAAVLAVALTLVLTAAPSLAGGAWQLDSSVACQPDGSATVTWTLYNGGRSDVSVLSANIEGLATQVVFTPNPIHWGETATATTNVSGTVKGEITVNVVLQTDGGEVTLTTTQDLSGDCPQPIATTTVTTAAAAPTTAVQATAAQAAAMVAPHFTG